MLRTVAGGVMVAYACSVLLGVLVLPESYGIQSSFSQYVHVNVF